MLLHFSRRQEPVIPLNYIALTIQYHEGRHSVHTVPHGCFPAHALSDVQTYHLRLLGYLLLQPINDGFGHQAGRSEIGVELQDRGLASPDLLIERRQGTDFRRTGAQPIIANDEQT